MWRVDICLALIMLVGFGGAYIGQNLFVEPLPIWASGAITGILIRIIMDIGRP